MKSSEATLLTFSGYLLPLYMGMPAFIIERIVVEQIGWARAILKTMEPNWLYSAIAALCAVVCLAIAAAVVQRRATPGSLELMFMTLAIADWAAAAAIGYTLTNPLLRIFMSKVQYIGVSATPVLFFLFVAEYTHQGHFLTAWWRRALWLLPLLTVALVWTNEYHHLVWRSLAWSGSALLYDFGPWFWVLVAYSYLMLGLSATLLVLGAIRLPGRYRPQMIAMLLSALFPWAGNVLYVVGKSPLPGFDTALVGMIVASLILAGNILKFGLLDLVPVARHIVVENMSDGLLVLDAQDRLMDINPAAQALIGPAAHDAVGKPIALVLAAWPELVARYSQVQQIQDQIVIQGRTTHYFDLKISPLYDQRKRYRGRVAVIRDITSQKLSEAAAQFSRQRLEEIIESISHGIFIVDTEGKITFANAAAERLFGMKREEIIGRLYDAPEWQITDADGQPLAREEMPLSKVLTGNQAVYGMEYALTHRDGHRLVLMVGAAPLHDAQGNIEGIVLDMEDITRRRLAQQIVARTAEELAVINRINMSITAGLEMNQLLRTLHRQCLQVLPADIFYVALYDEQSGIVQIPLYFEGEYLSGLVFDVHTTEGLINIVISSRRTLYLPDILEWRKPHLPLVSKGGAPARSYVGVPLIARERVIGVLAVQSYQPNAYTRSQIRLLESIAVQAAIAIENARLYAEVQRLAIVDELTGAYNYRGLLEFGRREVERARRFNRPLTAAFLDVNDFKAFNDRYGHAVGNTVLQQVAERMRSILRSVDIITRYGGDEFVVLFPETNLEMAGAAILRLCEEIAATKLPYSQGELSVSLSAGLAELSDEMDDLLALIDCANRAERTAKTQKLGVVAWFGEEKGMLPLSSSPSSSPHQGQITV